MNEFTIQFIVLGKLIWCAIFALLYGLGGMCGTWIRRYIGSVWAIAGLLIFSQLNWYCLVCLPLLIGALSLGYGGDIVGEKLWKRFYCAVAYVIALLTVFVINNAWLMFGLHTIITLLVVVGLGVFNFSKNARHEETIIGWTILFLPLMTV